MWVAPSGLFSQRYLRWAREVMGIERIMFATDYPFVMAENGGARRCLEEAPLTAAEREKIGSKNWETLVADIRR